MTPSALSILMAAVENAVVNAILPLINLTRDPVERAVLWHAVALTAVQSMVACGVELERRARGHELTVEQVRQFTTGVMRDMAEDVVETVGHQHEVVLAQFELEAMGPEARKQ